MEESILTCTHARIQRKANSANGYLLPSIIQRNFHVLNWIRQAFCSSPLHEKSIYLLYFKVVSIVYGWKIILKKGTRRKLSYSKYVVVWGLFWIWENLCLIPGFVQKHIQYIGINNNYLHILLCPPTSITKQIIEIDLRQLNIKDSLWCASNISKPHESRVVSGSKLLWKQFALPRLSVILFPRESLKETLFVTLLLLAKSKWTNEWWKKFRILAGLIFYVQKQLLQKHEFGNEFFLEEKVFSWVKSD